MACVCEIPECQCDGLAPAAHEGFLVYDTEDPVALQAVADALRAYPVVRVGLGAGEYIQLRQVPNPPCASVATEERIIEQERTVADRGWVGRRLLNGEPQLPRWRGGTVEHVIKQMDADLGVLPEEAYCVRE